MMKRIKCLLNKHEEKSKITKITNTKALKVTTCKHCGYLINIHIFNPKKILGLEPLANSVCNIGGIV